MFLRGATNYKALGVTGSMETWIATQAKEAFASIVPPRDESYVLYYNLQHIVLFCETLLYTTNQNLATKALLNWQNDLTVTKSFKGLKAQLDNFNSSGYGVNNVWCLMCKETSQPYTWQGIPGYIPGN